MTPASYLIACYYYSAVKTCYFTVHLEVIRNLGRRAFVAALYRPDMDHFVPSIIGYFITSDDWNEQTLLALKEKGGADFLVGIQTDDSECKYLFGHLDIIKGVIRCQPDDVEDVIKLLDVYSPRYDICLNAYDIKSLFECSHSFRFIQTIATGDCVSALIEKEYSSIQNAVKAFH